jgi:ATP-dependent Clp protease ATP-binding subunit ClpB
VDFKNSVVIMTSNLGGEIFAEGREPAEGAEAQLRTLLARHFRPEFLNRVDEIVVFRRLDRPQLREIVGLQLNRVADRLGEAGLGMEISDAARDYLVEVGYDPVYGARPLKRAIQRELEDPLALRLLSGDFQRGDVIRMDRDTRGLTFTPAQAARRAA